MLQKYHNIYALWYIYNTKSIGFIRFVAFLTHKKIISYMWAKKEQKKNKCKRFDNAELSEVLLLIIHKLSLVKNKAFLLWTTDLGGFFRADTQFCECRLGKNEWMV